MLKSKNFFFVFITFFLIFSGCASSSGYSMNEYKKAHIEKDGVYKFIEEGLLVKITSYKDEKTGKMKKKFSMLEIENNSKISHFNENDKGVIVWPFYLINKNKVGTRITKGKMGMSLKLDFSKAKLITK